MNNKAIYQGLSQQERDDLDDIARDMGLSIERTIDVLVQRFFEVTPNAAEIVRTEAVRKVQTDSAQIYSFVQDRTGS
jgi:hypothetical protein